jgi:hypothetical protein
MPIKNSVKICDIVFPKDFSLTKQGCTQSLACKFKQCPRKYLLSVNKWHSKKGQEKNAVGNIVHAVLSNRYTVIPLFNNKINSVASMFDSNMINKLIIEEIEKRNSKYQYIERKQLEYFKTVAYCVLINYLKNYANDFKTAYFTKVEEEFAVEIEGILWRGKRDGDHIVKKDKSLWVREIKNRSRINEDNIMQGLQFDFQSNLYCVTRDNDKVNTSGFIYDMIRTPQNKPKKDETLQFFSQRLEEEISKKPEYYFIRFEVPLTEKDKKIFTIELGLLNEDLTMFLGSEKPSIHKNSFSCIDGTFPCEYLEACTQGNMNNYYQSRKIFEELDCEY